jgi:hypothetical protein
VAGGLSSTTILACPYPPCPRRVMTMAGWRHRPEHSRLHVLFGSFVSKVYHASLVLSSRHNHLHIYSDFNLCCLICLGLVPQSLAEHETIGAKPITSQG